MQPQSVADYPSEHHVASASSMRGVSVFVCSNDLEFF
eukprot:SAG31_NODE_24435_length_481_cov_0.950262_1_plen_36_part_10